MKTKILLLIIFLSLTIVSQEQKKDTTCRYITNEIDDFTNKKVVKTDFYDLKSKKDFILIMLRNFDNKKSIVISINKDLGCANPNKNDRSNVKIKLENGKIVSFFHYTDIDCSNFTLIGKLSENDIKNLKSSPIQTIRFTGTKYYHDTKDLVYKDFFIDKLDCIK